MCALAFITRARLAQSENSFSQLKNVPASRGLGVPRAPELSIERFSLAIEPE